jgi:protein-disulfide isomerase
MSQKSNRNPPSAASPQPQTRVAPPASGIVSRRNIFIAAAVALLLAFAAAALFYRSEKAQSSQLAPAKSQTALASEQSPKFGNPAAKVHIVEFMDPACGTCAAFFPEVEKMMAANPDRIRLSVRHVPFHNGSDQVVRILEASRVQGKYLPTLEALYASQSRWVLNHVVQADQVWPSLGGVGLDLERIRNDMNAPAVSQRMEQDMGDARTLGVKQTPEFFVNGRPLPSFGLAELQNLVKDELQRAYP